ncbi:MAG: hypothetical protein BWY80_00353 [Firmicutes bacterium ADurb.Bin456]|nr:MAG: hypothetical protein BWY80_00353 [Firmicutes bacterium ADurb.Bin456]
MQPYPGTRLVNQVDGLVRQKPVRDVAAGQPGRRLQGPVGDPHAVMGLVFIPDSPQNFYRFFNCGFRHHNGLEAPLQGGVLFNMFAVFIQGGGPDALQFTPGQGRLQDVSRVYGPLRRPGAHQGVQFVNKHDYIGGLPGFFDNLLQAFFKFAPVLGPGHQGTHIQGDNPLVRQDFRYIAQGNPLG